MSATIPVEDDAALFLPPGAAKTAPDVPRFEPVASAPKRAAPTVSTRLCRELSQAPPDTCSLGQDFQPGSPDCHAPSKSRRKSFLFLEKSRRIPSKKGRPPYDLRDA